MTKEPPRILITRLSALGDAIVTLPLACAIKRAWPAARVEWLAEPLAAKILAGHPAIDDLHVIPRRALRSWRTVRSVRRQLRSRQIDCVLDPQGLTKSAVWGWLSGAKRRIVLARPIAREIAPWLATDIVNPSRPHVVDRQLELLKPLGIESPQVEFGLPRFAESRQRVSEWLSHHGIDRFQIINPGAQWPTKLWVPQRFGEVARALRDSHGLHSVVVWCGDTERDMAAQAVAASGGAARLAPATSLTELAELTRLATLFLSPDTGPLHLSVAVGTPTVGLYGPTQPDVCGPYGPPHRAIQAWYQGGRSRDRRRGENRAMRDIQPEQVIAVCREVLGAAVAAQAG